MDVTTWIYLIMPKKRGCISNYSKKLKIQVVQSYWNNEGSQWIGAEIKIKSAFQT